MRRLTPGSDDYELARKPAIASFHEIRPRAIVRCETPGDVAEAIAGARASGSEIAVRSGGHCFAGRSSTRGVLVDVTPMSSVSVTGERATIGAGARLADVYDALAGQGLTIPAGCGPTVGIAGLALGGGLGILGRKHGLTCDSLVGAQVVLADGRVVNCDERTEPDLFWALRGAGGGQFGVVTSLTFRTLAAPRATAFRLEWPHAHAVALNEAWQGWAPAAPDELAASMLVAADGDAGEPPVVTLIGALLGSEADAVEHIDELISRAGAEPQSSEYVDGSYREAKRYLSGLGGPVDDEEEVGHPYSKSEFFRQPLPAEAIGALVDRLTDGRPSGQARELDFTPWGGAYNRVPADATAFAHRDELFLLKQAVVVRDGDVESARRWLTASWALTRQWGSGGVYPNFPDPDLADWPRAYHGANYDRLVELKRRYDPDDVFRFHQSLPTGPRPAAARS
jgi:FAD/FMN-containing dehydrogenase